MLRAKEHLDKDEFIHGLTYWWILLKSNQRGHSSPSEPHTRSRKLLSLSSIQTAALEKEAGGGDWINFSLLENKAKQKTHKNQNQNKTTFLQTEVESKILFHFLCRQTLQTPRTMQNSFDGYFCSCDLEIKCVSTILSLLTLSMQVLPKMTSRRNGWYID